MDIISNKWPENIENEFLEISQSAICIWLGFVWPVPLDFVLLWNPADFRSFLVFLFPIFLFHNMTVRDEKMFLTVSRDLSTDRHQKDPKPLSHSTLGDKSLITNKFNQNSSNGPMRTFLTFCQFPDLRIEFCENECPKPLWFDI